MDRILTYTVQPDEENMLLLDFLRSKGFSRGILSSMKPYKGAIQLNGERGFGKSILHAGDFLRIHIPETENSENILPVKMDLSILYEDEDLLVINKPADMPVHPSIGNYDNTLANGAAWYFREKGQTFIYRCINRLDRDTTGALILAKNPYSAAVLSAQMKQRLTSALAAAAELEPENEWLTAQQALIPSAKISTIHSFCFSLIRENAGSLDVDSSFRVTLRRTMLSPQRQRKMSLTTGSTAAPMT